MRADMLAVYKIIHGDTDIKMEKLWNYDHRSKTRGHSFKLAVPKTCNTDIRRNAFSNRVVVPWNQLHADIVNSLNAKDFKRNYDNHMLKCKF